MSEIDDLNIKTYEEFLRIQSKRFDEVFEKINENSDFDESIQEMIFIARDYRDMCEMCMEVAEDAIGKVMEQFNRSEKLMGIAVERMEFFKKSYEDFFSDFAFLFSEEPMVAFQLCLDQVERVLRMNPELDPDGNSNSMDWSLRISWKSRFRLIGQILRDGMESFGLFQPKNKEVRKKINELRNRKRLEIDPLPEREAS